MKKNLQKAVYLVLAALTLNACKTMQQNSVPAFYPEFYKEGHRGTRGLMPENTIEAMIKGIQEGANVVEVDVYTSKDGKVIVSHDPTINPDHSLTPAGKTMTREESKKYVFHHMNYADIRKFDVGSKVYPAYPRQKKIKAFIPTMSELIDSVEAFTKANNLPGVIYNIELKSRTDYDSIYNAKPEVLVDAVMEMLKTKKIGKRFYMQSFDVRPLQYLHKKYPDVVLALLWDKKTFDENMAELGFAPQFNSPHYKLVTPEMIAKSKEKNMRVVPWTVNTLEEMQALKKMGVSGIITDYPDLFKGL